MGTDCKSAAFQLRWFESTRAHQTRKIRTYFRLEKGSDFSFSSGTTTKVPVDGAKLRYLVIDRKPITRFGGYDYEVRCKSLPFQLEITLKMHKDGRQPVGSNMSLL